LFDGFKNAHRYGIIEDSINIHPIIQEIGGNSMIERSGILIVAGKL
jgi:hypothetical protein